MKPITKILIIADITLTFVLVIQWYVLYMMNLGLPVFIPATPIKITGLLLVTSVVFTFIIAGKKIYGTDQQITVGKLTILLFLLGIAAEVGFQAIKLFWYEFDALVLLKNLGVLSLYYISIAFLTAFQIVTRRTSRLWLFIIIWLIIANIIIRWIVPMF